MKKFGKFWKMKQKKGEGVSLKRSIGVVACIVVVLHRSQLFALFQLLLLFLSVQFLVEIEDQQNLVFCFHLFSQNLIFFDIFFFIFFIYSLLTSKTYIKLSLLKPHSKNPLPSKIHCTQNIILHTLLQNHYTTTLLLSFSFFC